ncbi:MAG: GNAT family N-acetyltransferase [Flavobacteriales bacterium]|nr:GNAT family N-acetyltransferase [Flavobacteriales bacterium]
MIGAEEYWNLFKSNIVERFGKEPQLNGFLTELKMAFGWMLQNQHVEFVSQNGGMAALFARSIDSDNWSFGFLILPESEPSADTFWAMLCSKVTQLGGAKFTGPIQGTTYFPYRFVIETDGSPFFKGEYFGSAEEHHFMMKQMPAKVNYYRSGYRDSFDGIMAVSKPYYDEAVTKGFEVRTHAKVDEALFRYVFEMVGAIFGTNWNFKDMSAAEARSFYEHEFGLDQRMAVQTIYLKGELIGFCRYIENDDDTLICKTLGVLPAYQKLGLGNAAVYEMHRCAQDAGYTRMIYALIYDGNRVQQNMPKDDSIIFRKYASYEFDLNE